MLSPKKHKRNRPDTAPSALMSLVAQSVPTLAGQEVCEKLRSYQLTAICDKLNAVPAKSTLDRPVGEDARRYSIDDSLLNGSVKAKAMHRKEALLEKSQRSKEFEDVQKSRSSLPTDDSFVG